MILTPEILENKQVRHLAAVISVMCSDKERNYSFADYAKNHDADSNGHISENRLQDYEHSQQLLITWCFKVDLMSSLYLLKAFAYSSCLIMNLVLTPTSVVSSHSGSIHSGF